MKTNLESKAARKLAEACLGQCQKLIGQIKQAKKNLVTEFRDAFSGREQILQLAVNEAEALAWQTEYPHLVFPALALEKVTVATHWQQRQKVVRRTDPLESFFALAA